MNESAEKIRPAGTCVAVGEMCSSTLQSLAARYGMTIERVPLDGAIPGSFWGEPEAGLRGNVVYARDDTPLHSLLHEMCHFICMDSARRTSLERDAGSDDAEEEAVCYLQITLADQLPGVGAKRLMRDMDAWGYSFRLGATGRWYRDDATAARGWLIRHDLLTITGNPTFRVRED